MILAIDAGNSRVKWGGTTARDWPSIATVSLIEFAASSDHVNPFSVTHDDPERIVISNVAGDGAHQLLVNWTSIFDAEPLWLRGEAERCGVTQPLRAPRAARRRPLGGAGRGARRCTPAPAWWSTPAPRPPSTCSPATARFLGGAILPGVELMRFVLHEHTGRLPIQEGSYRDMPRNTIDAIETGCRHAQAGAVERMYRVLPRHRRHAAVHRLGRRRPRCWSTSCRCRGATSRTWCSRGWRASRSSERATARNAAR